MKHQKALNIRRERRTHRVRNQIRGTAARPRLTVFRSNSHMYCQVIDDDAGTTLVSASTRDKGIRNQVQTGGSRDAAKAVGQTIAERALAAGISDVCFDRGRYKFHGRVADLAGAAKEAGLSF